MKKTIKRANQRGYRNHIHFEFFRGIVALLISFGDSLKFITELILRISALLVEEDKAMDQIRKYEHTDEIHKLDEARDNVFYGIRDTIRRHHKSLDMAKAEAAKRLDALFELYKNVPKMPMPEESSALQQLLQHLDKMDGDVKLLGLADWVNDLRNTNERVRGLTDERKSESAKRINNHMKTVRASMDSIYADILSHIEAACVLEGNEKYASLCNQINAHVDTYKAIYTREKGKRKSEKSEELKVDNEELNEES
ncbi:MAG: DUF6261 family protein [Cytophagaceae bacterium]|nr:DUF6261 family protein [Cytophagaceae bacterium]